MFFSKKGKPEPQNNTFTIDQNNIPHHVAIIMDGNGRWANQRHLPRVMGHRQGMEAVKRVTIAASNLGIRALTLYAFSTENWKRPSAEVNYLMSLPVDFFDTFVPDLVENNVRVAVMGHVDQLPAKTQDAVQRALSQTKQSTGMVLNFALNYGSRDELITAVKKIAYEVQDGQINVDAIDETLMDHHLMTEQLGKWADPDLLIRTSGEKRISNFMLWQIAYSELVFTDGYWPDFNQEELEKVIYEYQQRHRRFGGLETKETN